MLTTTTMHHFPHRLIKTHSLKQKGFTIVELLIVIVVIAILAAMTIVAYNGIQNRANDSAVQSDLKNTYNKLLQYQVDNSSFPAASDAPTLKTILVASKGSYANGNAYVYCRTDADAAVVAQSKSLTGYYYGSQGSGTIPAASWTSGGATLCPMAGISSSAPGFLWFWYRNASVWQW